MKKIIYISILIISGCKYSDNALKDFRHNDSNITSDSLKSDLTLSPRLNDPKKFLDYFETIEKPKIAIEYFDNISPEDQFGKLIDKKYSRYITEQGLGWHNIDYKNFGNRFYAYYKFSLSKNKTVLIIRCPSIYEESEISLFIYNELDSTLKKSIILADNMGDAGYFLNLKSWLNDENGDGQVDIINRKQEFIPSNLPENSIFSGLRYDSISYFNGISDSFEKCYTEVTIDSLITMDGGLSFQKINNIKKDTIYFSNKKYKLINFDNYRH